MTHQAFPDLLRLPEQPALDDGGSYPGLDHQNVGIAQSCAKNRERIDDLATHYLENHGGQNGKLPERVNPLVESSSTVQQRLMMMLKACEAKLDDITDLEYDEVAAITAYLSALRMPGATGLEKRYLEAKYPIYSDRIAFLCKDLPSPAESRSTQCEPRPPLPPLPPEPEQNFDTVTRFRDEGMPESLADGRLLVDYLASEFLARNKPPGGRMPIRAFHPGKLEESRDVQELMVRVLRSGHVSPEMLTDVAPRVVMILEHYLSKICFPGANGLYGSQGCHLIELDRRKDEEDRALNAAAEHQELIEIQAYWPHAFDTGSAEDSLERIAIFLHTVNRVDNVSEMIKVLNVSPIDSILRSIGTVRAINICETVITGTKYREMQFPIFLLVGEIHQRLGATEFRAASQWIRGIELACVLKRILTRVLNDMHNGKTTTLAHNYFTGGRTSHEKEKPTGFAGEFRKQTGRSLNDEKLRQMLNKLEKLGFIKRGNHRTRATGSSDKFKPTTYQLGVDPPRIPLAWQAYARTNKSTPPEMATPPTEQIVPTLPALKALRMPPSSGYR